MIMIVRNHLAQSWCVKQIAPFVCHQISVALHIGYSITSFSFGKHTKRDSETLFCYYCMIKECEEWLSHLYVQLCMPQIHHPVVYISLTVKCLDCNFRLAWLSSDIYICAQQLLTSPSETQGIELHDNLFLIQCKFKLPHAAQPLISEPN